MNELGLQSCSTATPSAALSPRNMTASVVSNKRFRRSASMTCTQLSGIIVLVSVFAILHPVCLYLCIVHIQSFIL